MIVLINQPENMHAHDSASQNTAYVIINIGVAGGQGGGFGIAKIFFFAEWYC